MDTDLKFDRAKFDEIWQRVMPGTNENNINVQSEQKPTETHEAGQLRDFMDDEANDVQTYCVLASKCSDSTRQTLLRISSDERCHLKKLKAKYFILTGKTYTPPNACPLIYSVSETLRQKYIGEKDGAAAYLAAAEKTSNPELKDTYLALSEDEARHSKLISCLIENLF